MHDSLTGRRTELAGLTRAEVAQRVAAGKTNAYRPPVSRGVWSIVRANVFTLFNGVIGFCFVTLLVLGRWQDALFGFSALGNLILGSWQELRAKLTLDRLSLPSSPWADVVRDGDEARIPSDDIVLDDLVVVRLGERVPADARVVEADGLQVDESLLTGESDPVEKVPGDLLFGGSLVVGGEGRGVVERVGEATFANRLAAQARRFSLVSSELNAGIRRVLTWVTYALGPLAALIFPAQVVALGGWSALSSPDAWEQASVFGIAAVVAMIPLGLVLMTSIAFAVGAVRLAREGVLAQELAAVEVLARVDVICFDKTGTLTAGGVQFDEHVLLLDEGDAPRGWRGVLGWFASAPDANATARGLAPAFGSPVADEPAARVAFASERKWSAVGFPEGAQAPGSWVLGGPDVVFPDGRLESRTAPLTASGRRTLVLAHSADPLPDEPVLPGGLRPVALLVFRERIRPDAAETLAFFAREGIAIRVFSGDDPRTVAAIAREVGIPVGEPVDARELPDDPAALREAAESHLVVGRITPDQKRELTQALQDAGHTVAMIGDGVNDIPALKAADIGIAMSTGAPAARAVARMVLLEGRFSRLPLVFGEGRQVLANIERVSMLFFSKTVWAALLTLLVGLSVVEFPFLPRQLSVLDGLTIGIPAFLLALIPNSRPYRPGFLRRALGFAVPTGCAIALTLAGFAAAMTWSGVPAAEMRTGATVVLGVAGLWVLVLMARPFTLWKAFLVAVMAAGLVGVFVVPLVSDFLVLRMLTPGEWAVTAVTAAGAVVLIEAARAVGARVVAAREARGSRPGVHRRG